MLGIQLWKLRKGHIVVDRASILGTSEHISVAKVKKTLWQTARALVHIAIMQFIRGWALLSHYVAKKWQQWFGYAKPRTDGMPSHKESFFLHSVSEYKNRLKRIKQKLREKETPPPGEL